MLSNHDLSPASGPSEKIIYLDFASSTPLDPRVLEAMLPYYTSYYGNPAARLHRMGAIAENALGEARQFFASLLGAEFQQTIFVSSATEANNFVLRGLAMNPRRKRNRVLYAASEHSSIIETAVSIQNQFSGQPIEALELPIDACGQVDLERAAQLINDNTLCLCVMDVNNETGIVQNQLSELMTLAHRFGVHVHVDAVQGFARSDFRSAGLDYDSLVVSSGKIYGPKGAATIALRPTYGRLRLEPILTGGGQEFGLRSSTVNVPAVVGFARAAEIQNTERKTRIQHAETCEKLFFETCKSRQLQFTHHGAFAPRVAGILSVAFENVNAMKLLERVPQLCVSAGSACRTLQATASHVLLAMGIDLDMTLGSVRISFGTTTQLDEVREGAHMLADAVEASSQLSSSPGR